MPIVRNTTDGLIIVPVDHYQAVVFKFPPGHTHIPKEAWAEGVYILSEAHELEQFGRGIKPKADGTKEIPTGVSHFAKSHLKNGALAVLTVKKNVPEKRGDKTVDVSTEVDVESLKDLDAQAAEKVVADTHSSDTLNMWKETEGRDSVRAAIANRIEKFNKKPE
jgi:hypothetical protein